MAYSLTGMTSLGTIQSEDRSKDAQLFQMPLPRQNSQNSVLADIFGVSGTIRISGTFTVSDGTISTFISQLEGLITGTQTARTFHSDKSNSNYTVLIQTISWKSAEAGVNLVEYEISMIEGSAVT